jgi:mono/diheme cytochrome c family protein
VAPSDTTADTLQAPQIEPIPIDIAMELIASENVKAESDRPGAEPGRMYLRHCAGCHGKSGEGVITGEQVVPSSVLYLQKGRLSGRESEIMTNRSRFTDFMTEDLPGYPDHDFEFLSREALDEIFSYMRELAR